MRRGWEGGNSEMKENLLRRNETQATYNHAYKHNRMLAFKLKQHTHHFFDVPIEDTIRYGKCVLI